MDETLISAVVAAVKVLPVKTDNEDLGTIGEFLPETWLRETYEHGVPDPWVEDILRRCAIAAIQVVEGHANA